MSADDLATLDAHAAAAARLRTDHEALRSAIAAKEAALTRLRDALLPLHDLVERGALEALATRLGEEWNARNGFELARTLAAPDVAPAAVHFAPRLRDELGSVGAHCAAGPAAGATFLRALLERANYEAGSPAADRLEQTATLAAELEALKGDEERFVDRLNALGLNVTHRPDVVERRRNEARRLELEAGERAFRLAREREIDARYAKAAGPRTQRSRYIESGGEIRP